MTMFTENRGPQIFLQAITTRTNEVSINQQLLTGPGNSLVGRSTSFTNKSLILAVNDAYTRYSVMNPDTIVDEIARSGSRAWRNACSNAYESSKRTVAHICPDLNRRETLDTVSRSELSLLVWAGTFYHAFIGDFQLDNVIKGNLPLLNTGKQHRQTMSYGTLSTTIGVTTMTRTCNMETLASYFPDQNQRDAWTTHQETLSRSARETGIEGFSLESPVYNSINF